MDTNNSQKDKLTNAFTRDAFEPDFTAALEQAAKSNTPLTLATSDIDRFLFINQDHGMKVGDQVLQRVAEVFDTETPDDTKVYRYGGDEFYLIFPNTTREQALLMMEKIRLEIAKPYAYGASELKVHISMGIASYPIDGTDLTELQRQADQALYRTKKKGGKQISLAYDEKMIPKTVHFTETQLERLGKLADELSITEARLLREALDDLIIKYTSTKLGFDPPPPR
jgi:diguanylate cyclase (GGDEF)-like protein